jgi:glutamyl-tRNA synthetase
MNGDDELTPVDQVRRLLQAFQAGYSARDKGQLDGFMELFVADDQLAFDQKAVDKRLKKEGAAERLQRFRDRLASLDTFDAATTEAALRSFLEAEGVKIGEVIHSLRVATTGKAVGLGMFDCLEILGQDRVLARIDRALGML